MKRRIRRECDCECISIGKLHITMFYFSHQWTCPSIPLSLNCSCSPCTMIRNVIDNLIGKKQNSPGWQQEPWMDIHSTSLSSVMEKLWSQQLKIFFTRPQDCSFASRMWISGVFKQKTIHEEDSKQLHWQVKGRCIFTNRLLSGPNRFIVNSRLFPHIARLQQSESSIA